MPDTSAKPKRKRVRRYNDDYEPILCKQCGEEVYQVVNLEIRAPLGWNNLSKMGLRSNRIQIIGASYDASHWTCGCGVRPPTGPKDTRLGPIRRKVKPILSDRKVTGEHRPPKVIRDPIDAS